MRRILRPLIALVSLLGVAGSAVADYDFVQIDVPGGRTSWAHGINDVGQIVGGYWDGSRIHGFVRESDGTFTSVDVPGSTDTYADGINNVGEVVGYFYEQAGQHLHGFVLNGSEFVTIDAP